jgi:hypothetical protein
MAQSAHNVHRLQVFGLRKHQEQISGEQWPPAAVFAALETEHGAERSPLLAREHGRVGGEAHSLELSYGNALPAWLAKEDVPARLGNQIAAVAFEADGQRCGFPDLLRFLNVVFPAYRKIVRRPGGAEVIPFP